MKRLSFLVACVIFASMPCAFADTFDFSAGLRENVRKEISDSALSKTVSMAGICRKRIRLLKNMVREEHTRTVMQAINIYMQSANLHVGDFEIGQLRRSRNFDELTHNANSLIRAYKALRSEVGDTDAVAGEGEEVAAAATTTRKAKKGAKSSGKKRPNRQNMTHRGRFNRQ